MKTVCVSPLRDSPPIQVPATLTVSPGEAASTACWTELPPAGAVNTSAPLLCVAQHAIGMGINSAPLLSKAYGNAPVSLFWLCRKNVEKYLDKFLFKSKAKHLTFPQFFFRKIHMSFHKYQRHDSFTLRESFNTKERKFTFGDFGSSVVQKKACSTDKWYHFVAVVDNGDLKFYINGKLNNVGGKDRPLTRNRESVNLGRCYSSRYFLGAMDNVRIYKRVLSAKEVKELYASEK